ncbi:MAG TPA: alpha/beta hydrolase [Symbiobacteriaceae bacterium]|nr:alpha/beta hydrolase [Symbiobacteriaceae bacterium]
MPEVRIANGLNMAYREYGTGDKVVLFIHGNAATSLWWARVFPHLPREWRAVAPDLRGCGDTDKPSDQWAWPVLADDIYEFARALGLTRFMLVGHSLGGVIAQQLAADHPELVERLVMVNPGPPEGFQFPPEWWARSEALAQMPDTMKMALAAMMPTAPKDEFYTQLLDESIAKSLGAWLKHTRALEDTCGLAEKVKSIMAPTLIVYGQQDMLITLPMMEQLRDRIPGATLELWECGHSACVEAPDRLARRLAAFA